MNLNTIVLQPSIRIILPRCKHRYALTSKVFCVLVCMIVSLNISAQFFSMSGCVVDEQGIGLPNTYLIALDPETSEVFSATTSLADGKFVLTSLPTSFLLNVTHLGYESQNITINGETDLEMTKVIRMQYSSIQLEEVVVKANVPKIEREIGKFVMRNIAASPFAKGSSTYDFLRFIPMVNVKPEGGISILGRTDAIIQIDGRSPGTNQMAIQMLKGILASDIAHIEIIPVTGSAYAAENRSGIINVVLKKRPNDGVRLTMTVVDRQGYYNSPQGLLFLNYAGKQFAFTAGVSASYDQLRQESDHEYDYLCTDLQACSEFRDRTKCLHGSSYININYSLFPSHKLGAQFSFGVQDYQQNSSSNNTYREVGSSIVDSVCIANTRTCSPSVDLNLGGNLNYAYNNEDSKTRLTVDVDFKNNSSERNIYSIYHHDDCNSSSVADDFIQSPKVKTRVFGGRMECLHDFTKENMIKFGLCAYYGNTDNNFFYFRRIGECYVNDLGRSNHFVYTDHNLAGYACFKLSWSEKLKTEIGIRAEKYHAHGILQKTSETVKRDEFDLFPSLSLIYIPSNNHEISIDFSRSTARPYYGLLNPFIIYTSPLTFKQNNPKLKSSKGYELLFSYTLFDDYMMAVDYFYDDDLWTEFNLPIGDLTCKYIDNYGNSHMLDVSLLASKSLFNGYWNISAEAWMSYNRTRGVVNDYRIDFNDTSFGLRVKTNLALSKQYNCHFNLKFDYSSKSRSAAFNITSTQELEMTIMKQFGRANLSLGVYNVLMPTVKVNNAFEDYLFSIISKRYVTGVLTFSYTFGNQHVNRIDKRQNDNIEKRIQ